ncbi:MAG: DUF167 family protein [Alphaproteobacteria bacterium]|nr:DUF167 family protein [Alphaproteobacteria bacterium]
MASDGPLGPEIRVSETAGGVLVPVRLTPRGGRDRIDGIVVDGAGTARLGVRVRAAAEGGKANAALIALLAKSWKLPKSAFTIAAGARARAKTVLVAAEAPAILARIRKQGSDP